MNGENPWDRKDPEPIELAAEMDCEFCWSWEGFPSCLLSRLVEVDPGGGGGDAS